MGSTRAASQPLRAASHHGTALGPLALGAVLLLSGCSTLRAPQSEAAAPARQPTATAPAAATAAAAAATAAPRPASRQPAQAAPATGAAAAGPQAAPAGPGGPSGVAGPAPGTPPPFAQLIRDARRVEGPLTFWHKEDKVWIELTPEQLGKPFLLSPKISNGIGEGWVLGGLMVFDQVNGYGGPQVVEFVRVHNTIRLQARNTLVFAQPGSPEARALEASYSNSLLGAAPVASGPHPDRKSVLVEANALFLNDLLGIGNRLQRSLRAGYGLERGNTVFTGVRGNAEASILEVQAHFVGGGTQQQQQAGLLGALLGAMPPGGPRFVPDARSMLIGLHYSLAPLPAQPMPVRVADPRLGLFTTNRLDFSDDLQRSPRQRLVTRWRLEKKDPAAELSEPVKPIVFWIDRNVPHAYRETVRSGILEWNKAFERIGFRNAIQVEQQPDDANWDTLDFGRASVRWMLNADPSFGAIGPSHVDPRTGEILDADIAFEGLSARGVRTVRSQVLGSRAAGAADQPFAPALPDFAARPDAGLALLPPDSPAREPHVHGAWCLHAQIGQEQLGYALDVLQARGELEPDSPIAQQFVLDYVKDSIMHEVGHALGLRHNFRASRAYTEAQLADPEFTRAHGTSASVMEYNAVNLPRPGERGGQPFQTTLGPYDYWAIEYAYKPAPGGATPQAAREAEQQMLQAIAARNTDPLLAFGTDEDSAFGVDPETLQLDLGNDPISFASKRLEIARDLFRRQETRALPPDNDYTVLRRSIDYALADATRAVGVLVRQIGGLRTLRDFPGSGREPLQPVEPEVQRQALKLISDAVLARSALTLTPALQRRMAPNYLDRGDGLAPPTDVSPAERLLNLQRAVLNYLLSDFVARRVLDNIEKTDRPRGAFTLGELYAQLERDVWDGAAQQLAGGSIPSPRRELQRDYVNRLAAAVLRPAAQSRTDGRSLQRAQALGLVKRLQELQQRARAADAETRAHLEDSLDTLRGALAAPMPRQSL